MGGGGDGITIERRCAHRSARTNRITRSVWWTQVRRISVASIVTNAARRISRHQNTYADAVYMVKRAALGLGLSISIFEPIRPRITAICVPAVCRRRNREVLFRRCPRGRSAAHADCARCISECWLIGNCHGLCRFKAAI
jgi:hypothetical protein